jgi:hypothetical protein
VHFFTAFPFFSDIAFSLSWSGQVLVSTTT